MKEDIEETLLIEMPDRPFQGVHCMIADDEKAIQNAIMTAIGYKRESYIIFSSDYDFLLNAEELAKDNSYKTIVIDIYYDFHAKTIRKKMRAFPKMQKDSYFALFLLIPQNPDPQIERAISYCRKRIRTFLNFYKKRDWVTVVIHPYHVIQNPQIGRPRIFHKVSLCVTSDDARNLFDVSAWRKILQNEKYHMNKIINSS